MLCYLSCRVNGYRSNAQFTSGSKATGNQSVNVRKVTYQNSVDINKLKRENSQNVQKLKDQTHQDITRYCIAIDFHNFLRRRKNAVS